MDTCMLVNMQRIMVFLRFDIENEKGKEVLSVFRQGLEGLICNDKMCEEIVGIMPDWQGQLMYGEDCEQAVEEELIAFVKQAVQVMEDRLVAGEYDMAYDIADILHVLPDILMQSGSRKMRSYWKRFLEKFQKKWNCDMFHEYKRCFKKTRHKIF